MDGVIGVITMFGGNFAPRSWAFCNGQLLPISQNNALFSILGTTYGGDGRSTFGLPDLRGKAPIHAGTGPGLSPRAIGQHGGAETTTLLAGNMPSHNHSVTATLHAENRAGGENVPAGRMLGRSGQDTIYSDVLPADDVAMASEAIVVTQQNAGGGQAFNNMQPFQVVNYIICLQGIFPSRN
ncbi:MAG: tail fiber protein [Actinomycetota bacterium]